MLHISNIFSCLCSMTDERLIQILQEQLADANTEKAELLRRVSSLLDEIRGQRKQSRSVQEDLREALAVLSERMEKMGARLDQSEAERARANEQVEKLLALVSQMREANKSLEEQLKSQRGKRFGRTSEQAKWLNNRAEDRRAREWATLRPPRLCRRPNK